LKGQRGSKSVSDFLILGLHYSTKLLLYLFTNLLIYSNY
jgi:hypothetical protein